MQGCAIYEDTVLLILIEEVSQSIFIARVDLIAAGGGARVRILSLLAILGSVATKPACDVGS